MKFLKPLSIVLISLTMLVSSCGSSQPQPEPEPEGADIFDKLDLGEGQDMNISDEELKYHSNQDYDVGKDYRVKVAIDSKDNDIKYSQVKNALLHPNTNGAEMITIKDNHGTKYQTAVDRVQDEHGNEYFEVYPFGSQYREGAIFTASIKDNSLVFKDRDPNFRELYFSIPREETNYYNVSNEVPFYDINQVKYFSIADGDYSSVTDPYSDEAKEFFANATFHFGYLKEIKLEVGKIFGVTVLKNGRPDLNEQNTFYGSFVSCEPEQTWYKITYKMADITQIFKDDDTGDVTYDVHQSVKNAELRNIRKTLNEKEFKNEFMRTRDMRCLTAALAEATNNSVQEILSYISVNAKVSYKDGVVYVQISLGAVIPFGESGNNAISVNFIFQWTISFDSTGEVKLKKILGIPYWLTAYAEVTKITDFTFTFKIGYMRGFVVDPDTRPISQRIGEAYNRLQQDDSYFKQRTDDNALITANHISQPLLALEIPFGGVFSFKVQLSLEVQVDLNVLFEYSVHVHTVEKILSFSTDSGVANTSNTTKQSGTTHNFALGGTLYIAIGLKLQISVGICGLSSLFSLGAGAEGGIYFQLQAMGGVTFGSDVPTTWYGALKIEIGFYGNLYAFLDFLFVFHFKYEFLSAKWAFVDADEPITAMAFLAQDLTLTKYITSTDATKLLGLQVFDGDSFSFHDVTYQLNSQIKTFEGEKITPLTLTSDSKYITFDKEYSWIIVPEDSPAYFTANITVTLNDKIDNWMMNGTPTRTKTVKVTFQSDTAKKLQVSESTDEKFTILVEPGKKVLFPTPVDDRTLGEDVKFSTPSYKSNGDVTFSFNYNAYVYDFLSFYDGSKDIAGGEQNYVMPKLEADQEPLVITVKLYKIVYYTVNFYDGNNKLIKTEQVRENTAAPQPTAKECEMSGYNFLGWDIDTSYVTKDMNVYGIYAKGSSTL